MSTKCIIEILRVWTLSQLFLFAGLETQICRAAATQAVDQLPMKKIAELESLTKAISNDVMIRESLLEFISKTREHSMLDSITAKLADERTVTEMCSAARSVHFLYDDRHKKLFGSKSDKRVRPIVLQAFELALENLSWAKQMDSKGIHENILSAQLSIYRRLISIRDSIPLSTIQNLEIPRNSRRRSTNDAR